MAKKPKKVKNRKGVIFHISDTKAPDAEYEKYANQRLQQKNLDTDTYQKNIGTKESLNPSNLPLNPERW